jgi:hypothetical protein
VTTDPHLEEVVGYLSVIRREAVLELAPPLCGFVAAVALMPDRWLRTTALYVGFSCALGLLHFLLAWRRLLPRLRSAPPMPRNAVEVRERRIGLGDAGAMLLQAGFLLGGGWVWAALEDNSFASGLAFAAVLLGAYPLGDLAVRWSVGKWERRNGRVLTSQLLGEGEVFYVERGAHAA